MNEWETEPDQEEFVHAELPCLILRGPVKSLCGYVGVPPSHPMYQKEYNDINVVVHGGPTFSHLGGFKEIYREPARKPPLYPPDRGSPEEMLLWMEETGNYFRECIIIERLEPDPDDKWPEGFWWVGFDCAHLGDYVPGVDEALGTSRSRQETYRNWAWVKAETQRLAEQLAAMMPIPDYNEWIESVRKGGDTNAGKDS